MIVHAVLVVLAFVVGWMGQALFLFFAPAHLPAPHWLLLVVLAVGSGGRIYVAQGLGFFWGLALDLYGQTPFGAQAALLAMAGYVSGILSRKVNATKLIAQETLTLGGTLLYLLGVGWMQTAFEPVGGPRPLNAGLIFGEILLNALTAPAVFWVVQRLMALDPNNKSPWSNP